MSDRELLELAAKAAGVEVWFPRMADGKGGALEPCHTSRNGQTEEWNPLTDDGDALRLAVKIGIRDYFGLEVQKTYTQATSFEPWEHCEYEEYKDHQDPYAATRRAIVRAAAAIGKEMP